MWPWEHVVLGYVVYSLFCHLSRDEPPGGVEAAVVVFASLLPDLVDKPLAWSFGLVETGYGPAHSLFLAVPLVVVAVAGARAAGRTQVGVAFAVGYLLHLPGDVFHRYVGTGQVSPEVVLWPVATYGADPPTLGFVAESVVRVGSFRAAVFAGDISLYTTGQLALTGFAFLLWVYDGTPVLRQSVDTTRALIANSLGR